MDDTLGLVVLGGGCCVFLTVVGLVVLGLVGAHMRSRD
jgi:hypothetical protein